MFYHQHRPAPKPTINRFTGSQHRCPTITPLRRYIQIMHTIIPHTPLSPYTRHLRHYFRQLHSFYSKPIPHHVMTSYTSPGDKPQSAGGQSKRTLYKAKSPHENQSSTYAPVISNASYLLRIVVQSLVSSVSCPMIALNHPFNITSVFYYTLNYRIGAQGVLTRRVRGGASQLDLLSRLGRHCPYLVVVDCN